MSYQDVLNEDRRLVLLRLLSELPGGKANSSVLVLLLDRWGHAVSRDYLRTQLTWLAAQDLIAVEEVEGILLATLTERGREAAEDRIQVPGVRRPRR